MTDQARNDSARRPRVVILKFAPVDRDPRMLRQIALLRDHADIISVGFGPAPAGVAEHIELPTGPNVWRTNRLAAACLYVGRSFRRLYFGSPSVQAILEAIEPGSMDVVLANDALGVPVALALRPRGGVHADLHEYAPRQGASVMWKLLVAPLMRWACRQARGARSVSTVAPGIALEYERSFGYKCSVVPNAARYRADLSPTAVGDRVRLVHIGLAGRARKLETMIDAVALADRAQPGRFSFDLYLAPGDEAYIAELAARAGERAPGVVRVLPPVPYDQMVTTLAGYDVGMFVCPPTTFNLEHALPNKFFEFVQARLAVVIGPSVEMADYVRQFGFGAIADDFTPQATAEVLTGLTADRIAELKEASDAAAADLSSERLSLPWRDAVLALIDRARTGGDADTRSGAPNSSAEGEAHDG